MKKLLVLITMVLMLTSAVLATETTLTPDSMSMDYVDVQSVEYCIEEQGVPQDVTVVVDPICKDQNTLLGCNAGDIYNPPGFSVVPDDTTTGADGCVDLTITTSLSPGQEGLFYYTVNGDVGGSYVGAETGNVFIPEMGIIGAMVVLAGAGLFIAKKRK